MKLHDHFKNLVEGYQKIDSPSKRLLKSGVWIFICSFSATVLLSILSLWFTPTYFVGLSQKMLRFSIHILLLTVVSAFVFDIVSDH